MNLKNILMIVALAVAASCVGCVPRSRVIKQMDDQYNLGFKNGRVDAFSVCNGEVYKLRDELEKKNARLARLGELNKDKTLKTKLKWTGDSWEDDVTGNESWQK